MLGRAGNSGGVKNNASDPTQTNENPQNTPIVAKRSSRNNVEEDPSKSLGSVESLTEKEDHFPDLKRKSVLRVAKSGNFETEMQLTPGKPIVAASTGAGGMADDIRPVDLVRHSEWGKQGSEPHLFMRELVDDLLASEKYDKAEMIVVGAEDERNILRCFDEALWQNEMEQLDRPSRKRFRSLSNIQIVVVIDGRVKIYLLIAEEGHPSNLTHICATAINASTISNLSVTEEIEAALDAQGHYEVEDIYGERTQYFMQLPDIASESDLSKALQYVSRHLELYCDIFQSTVI